MESIGQIELLLLRSRRALGLAVSVVLLVFALVVGVTTLLVRQSIRQQIAGRDGAVLEAVALAYYGQDVQDGIAGPITDPGNQLSIVLRSSEIRGVLGVRLFSPEGRFVESFPPYLRESELDRRLMPSLAKLRPTSQFRPRVSMGELFYASTNAAHNSQAPLLEVNVPLHVPEGPLAGVAQFLLEGQSIASEFSQLDRHLAAQAATAFIVGGALVAATVGWAFRRLRRAHGLVAERTESLRQANRELALAAKTTALGAVTAHLIHGLKNPLAGLHQYVAAGAAPRDDDAMESDRAEAISATRRMQALVQQVVGVLREEQTATTYEFTGDELLAQVKLRLEPLAQKKGVRLELIPGPEVRLPNRVANLVVLVLGNLGQNAIEATPPGTQVQIETSQVAEGTRFEVRDQGPGFPAGLTPFAPCESTKAGGSGIGLALCKQLAHHLEATLELTSPDPGQCVFTLILPGAFSGAAGTGAAEAVVAPGTRSGGGARVWLPVLIALVLASPLGARAVNFPLRWRWSNPLPNGANLVDMACSTSPWLSVQVAERGQIFTSDDLELWLPRDTFLTNALEAVTFFGPRIVVTGENGLVLYADDVEHFQAGTLLDGPTTDWLEAVTASPRLVVAVGDNGAIYASTNGAAWSRQNSGSAVWLRGVAFGAGNFVAVGETGTILTSPEGKTWSKRTSPTTHHLNRVQYILGRFTAVGEAGVTLSSTNAGTNWFAEITGATNSLQNIAAGGPDRLVDGSLEVRLQDAGVWSNELAKTNAPPAWTYYSAFGQSNYFLISGRTGMQAEGFQVGTTPYGWQTPYGSVRNWLWDVLRLPAFYIAVGDFGTVLTSGNGADWTLELVPTAVTNTTFLGVGGTTNLLLAAGDSGTVIVSPNLTTNLVFTNATGVVTQSVSTLGVLWFSIPKFTTNDLQGLAVLSNSVFAITGERGSIFTSTDGSNWISRPSGTTNLLSSVSAWPGGLVATGYRGTLLTSPDGNAWTKIPTATTNWLYRVRWLNGSLVVVGQNGVLLTSTDGLTWSNRNSGTTAWLNDATFIQDTWFVAGVNGTVLTSSNLVNWDNCGTATKKSLYAAATDSQQLILVGVEGAILRSPVVPDLSPVEFLDFSRVVTNQPGPTYNVYLFGGKPDQQFTLNRATNLLESAWTASASLEIFDGSGTLYYVETLGGTNLPLLECYRSALMP